MTTVLPDREVQQSQPPAFRVQGRAAADTRTAAARSSYAPFLHDTCHECGWDGDAPIVVDPDMGAMGWECPNPDCRAFIVTRDLISDEREDMFA